MKILKSNTNENGFLKKGARGKITSNHKEYLGMAIPEGYFKKSKQSILDKIKEEREVVLLPVKPKMFWLQPSIGYVAAVFILFLVGACLWFQNVSNTHTTQTKLELLSFNHDILLDALLVDDDQLNSFAEATLINEVVLKAQLLEQELDDFPLDALILEDTLLEDYIDFEFVEKMIF